MLRGMHRMRADIARRILDLGEEARRYNSLAPIDGAARLIRVLEAHGVATLARTTVDRLACRTEDLLAGIHDPEAAWSLLQMRRDQALRDAP